MKINVTNNNGRCQIRFTHPTTKKRFSKTYGDYSSGNDRHTLSGVALRIGADIDNATFTGDIDAYFAHEMAMNKCEVLKRLHARERSKDVRVCKAIYRHVLRYHGELQHPVDGDRFMVSLNLSPATHNRYLTTLKVVAPSVFGHIKGLKTDSGEPNPFTLDESGKITKYFIGTPHEEMVAVWFMLGLRPGELRALDLHEKLKMRGDRISVLIDESCKSNGEIGLPKNGRVRKVPIGKGSAETLLSIVAKLPPGRCWQNLRFNNFNRRVWYPALENLGIEKRVPYCIRHTAISTYLDKEGCKAVDAAKLFGTSIGIIEKHYLGSVREVQGL